MPAAALFIVGHYYTINHINAELKTIFFAATKKDIGDVLKQQLKT